MKRGKLPRKVEARNAGRIRCGIVLSEYYEEITGALLEGALSILKNSGVAEKNIVIERVAGSFEIPYGCLRLLQSKKFDVILTLGCIIKGQTDHDRYITHAISQGIINLTLKHGVPITFGVITANNYRQALARSVGDMNKGREAAIAALSLFKDSPR